MGEYVTRKSDGEHIKIGTCETLDHLRYDQRDAVTGLDYLTDPEALAAVRFRFPFPSEDGTAPGDFTDDGTRRIPGEVTTPEEVKHSNVQFTASNGYLLLLPCPEANGPQVRKGGAYSDRAITHGTETIGVALNGYGGAASLAGQAVRHGALVPIIRCNGCRTLWNLTPALARDLAQLYSDAAEHQRTSYYGSEHTARDYDAIAQRILDGLNTPIPATA